ncbi:MAG: exosortase Y-associated Wzy-like protein [Mucilaginibacter sp.]|uniref:exosortase Y-associated Wzy-like protein n=1 Tax=Mucilaginibacter sp. TaxID=1882438 RepID=UPI0034E5FF96
MFNQIRPERFFVLYLPCGFSWLFDALPQTSYLIAWLGSFFIFLITISGWVKPIPKDRSLSEQLMRPLFLTQLIFAGYMCCTTLFYYLDALGYENFHQMNRLFKPDPKKLMMIAECQRYYCLGHAAFITGTLLFMNYPVQKKYQLQNISLADFLLYVAIITVPVAILFTAIPGLNQFSAQFSTLSFIAGALALAFAIPIRKTPNIIISGVLFGFNFYKSVLSGYKEPIILSFLVLAIFLFPFYKRIVILVFVPLLFLVFAVLPTYNQVFRQNAWSGNLSAEDASKVALDAALSNSLEAKDSNWSFLVFRLSEIDMFVKYIQSTPKYTGFYGMKMIGQSFQSLIPRAFWPGKPNTEDLVMERAFNAGIAAKGMNVSAKPALIADAYLFEGEFGIFFILLLYGAVNQFIALKAESLFGGYVLGTALIYSGLFQIMWRGLSFEFLFNSVFWSYISMLLIAKLLYGTRILKIAD